MRTVKVSDLSGPALDWAVAKCEGHLKGGFFAPCKLANGTLKNYAGKPDPYHDELPDYSPSSDWSLAGPIIERERIDVCYVISEDGWQAITADSHFVFRARTPLIAAMRCYVASEIGDTVEVPEELM